jgi:hypothetical protein
MDWLIFSNVIVPSEASFSALIYKHFLFYKINHDLKKIAAKIPQKPILAAMTYFVMLLMSIAALLNNLRVLFCTILKNISFYKLL